MLEKVLEELRAESLELQPHNSQDSSQERSGGSIQIEGDSARSFTILIHTSIKVGR